MGRARNENRQNYVIVKGRREHMVIVEKALGRRLRGQEQVHHVNGDKRDNRPENLVLCPDASYHQLLETRTRALKECGNPNWRKCRKCLKWDDPANMQSKRAMNGLREMTKYWHFRYKGQCVNKGDKCETRRAAPRPAPLFRGGSFSGVELRRLGPERAAALAELRRAAWKDFIESDTPLITSGDDDVCACGERGAKRYGESPASRFYCVGCGRQKKAGYVGRTPGAGLTVDTIGRRIA